MSSHQERIAHTRRQLVVRPLRIRGETTTRSSYSTQMDTPFVKILSHAKQGNRRQETVEKAAFWFADLVSV